MSTTSNLSRKHTTSCGCMKYKIVSDKLKLKLSKADFIPLVKVGIKHNTTTEIASKTNDNPFTINACFLFFCKSINSNKTYPSGKVIKLFFILNNFKPCFVK